MTLVKTLPAGAGDAKDTGSVPGSGRSPGVGSGNPLQYSCLESFMDRGAQWGRSIGSQRAGHDWTTAHTHICYSTSYHTSRNDHVLNLNLQVTKKQILNTSFREWIKRNRGLKCNWRSVWNQTINEVIEYSKVFHLYRVASILEINMKQEEKGFQGKESKTLENRDTKCRNGGKEKSKAKMVFCLWINEGYGFHPETQSKTTFKH